MPACHWALTWPPRLNARQLASTRATSLRVPFGSAPPRGTLTSARSWRARKGSPRTRLQRCVLWGCSPKSRTLLAGTRPSPACRRICGLAQVLHGAAAGECVPACLLQTPLARVVCAARPLHACSELAPHMPVRRARTMAMQADMDCCRTKIIALQLQLVAQCYNRTMQVALQAAKGSTQWCAVGHHSTAPNRCLCLRDLE